MGFFRLTASDAPANLAEIQKNWLFVGGEDTAERRTIIYTVIEDAGVVLVADQNRKPSTAGA